MCVENNCTDFVGGTFHLFCNIFLGIILLVLIGFTTFVGCIELVNGHLFSGIFTLLFVFLGLPFLLFCLYSCHLHYHNRQNIPYYNNPNYYNEDTLRNQNLPYTPQSNIQTNTSQSNTLPNTSSQTPNISSQTPNTSTNTSTNTPLYTSSQIPNTPTNTPTNTPLYTPNSSQPLTRISTPISTLNEDISYQNNKQNTSYNTPEN